MRRRAVNYREEKATGTKKRGGGLGKGESEESGDSGTVKKSSQPRISIQKREKR